MSEFDQTNKADLHIHTVFSDGAGKVEDILAYAEHHTDLSVIAITDHDTIEGAVLAQQIAQKKGLRLQVIVGEEVTCLEGHMIGLFLKEKIEPGQSAAQVLREIKKQGGLAIAPHPLMHTRMRGPNIPIMDGIGYLALLDHYQQLDGVEILNATPFLDAANFKAQLINSSLRRSEVGGSDAHIIQAVGKGYTTFYGDGVDGVRQSIIQGTTQAGSERWEVVSLLKYLVFFIPLLIAMLRCTWKQGLSPRRPQLAIEDILDKSGFFDDLAQQQSEGLAESVS